MGDATGATLISLLVPSGTSALGNEPTAGGTEFVDALASLGITLSRYGAATPSQLTANVVCGEGQPMPHTQAGVLSMPVDLSDSQPSITVSITASTPRAALPVRIVPSESSSLTTTCLEVPVEEVPMEEVEVPMDANPGTGRVEEQLQQLLEIVIPVPVSENFDLPEFLRLIDAALAEVLGSGGVELVEQSPSTEPANPQPPSMPDSSSNRNLAEDTAAQPTTDRLDRATANKSMTSSIERTVANESEVITRLPSVVSSAEQNAGDTSQEARAPVSHTYRTDAPTAYGSQPEVVQRPDPSKPADASRQVAEQPEQDRAVGPLTELRLGSDPNPMSTTPSRPVVTPLTPEHNGVQDQPTHRVSVVAREFRSSEMLGEARIQMMQQPRATASVVNRNISLGFGEPDGEQAASLRAGVVNIPERVSTTHGAEIIRSTLPRPQQSDGTTEVRGATLTGVRLDTEATVPRVEPATATHRSANITIETPVSAKSVSSPVFSTEPERTEFAGSKEPPVEMVNDREQPAEKRGFQRVATTGHSVSRDTEHVGLNVATHASVPSVGQVVPTPNNPNATVQNVSAGRADAPRAAALPEETTGPRTEWVTLRMEDSGDGAARLRVAVRGELVHTAIVHDDPAVAQALRENSAELRQALERQGFTNLRVTVNGTEGSSRADAASTANRGDADPRNSDDGGRRDRERDLSDRQEDKHSEGPDDRERSRQRSRGNRKGRE